MSAEIAARQPVDYVCVDTQHGVIDYQVSASMVQAIELTGGTPIVRVPWNEPGIIGKSLDAGAHGVIVPMVNTRAQAEAVVRSARYAPDGARSWGPVMAGMRHDDHRTWAAETIAVIPMIETAEAIANLDEILSVSGVDAIYVGPADLGVSLGLEPYRQRRQPGLRRRAGDHRRGLSTTRGRARHPRHRSAHPGPPAAGLPHDHGDKRWAGDAIRIRQRARRRPTDDGRGRRRQALLTVVMLDAVRP